MIAIASPALAEPVRLPDISVDARRPASDPPVILGPATPMRAQAVLDDAGTTALEQRVSETANLQRIAALDELTASLDQLEVDLDDPTAIDRAFALLAKYYTRIVQDPDLERYPHAAELLVRAARSLGVGHERIARSAAERVIAKYPRSPFATDARFLLATYADEQNKHAVAKRHLDAVIAVEKRHAFLIYAVLRRGSTHVRLGNHTAAVDDLRRVVSDAKAASIHDHAIKWGLLSFAHVLRADIAALLFDSVDRSQAASWLRELAAHYGELGKRTEQIAALRLAIARDGDRDATCRDRVDIVTAMAGTKNRIELELAIAELADALPLADRTCALAADQAVGEVAYEAHERLTRKTRVHVRRLWNRAVELATSTERREQAIANRDSLR